MGPTLGGGADPPVRLIRAAIKPGVTHQRKSRRGAPEFPSEARKPRAPRTTNPGRHQTEVPRRRGAPEFPSEARKPRAPRPQTRAAIKPGVTHQRKSRDAGAPPSFRAKRGNLERPGPQTRAAIKPGVTHQRKSRDAGAPPSFRAKRGNLERPGPQTRAAIKPGVTHQRKSRDAGAPPTGSGSNFSATMLTTASWRSTRPRISNAGALRASRR